MRAGAACGRPGLNAPVQRSQALRGLGPFPSESLFVPFFRQPALNILKAHIHLAVPIVGLGRRVA